VSRVLFAWEFGGDLGHARRLVPIARELRKLGHEPLFVFRDVAMLGTLAAEGFEWFAAPRIRQPALLDAAPLNASDILLNLGYGDGPALGGALRAWLTLLDFAKPALVVADYAPTALMAARAAKIRRVTLGTGFSVPPRADPLPALRAWQPVADEALRRLDMRLVESVRGVFDRLSRGASAPRVAADVFDADAHLLCTLPELDPFGSRDGVEYLGPQGDARTGASVAWRKGKELKVFAYLKARDTRFRAIVEALAQLRGDAIVAAPDATPDQAVALCSAGVRVIPDAVQLEGFLDDADLCVFHAGPGLAARALVAGVPMALLPMQLEQFLVGRRLVAAGVAGMVAPEGAMPDLRAWFADVAANQSLRAKAGDRATALAGYRFDEAAARTAQRIVAGLH
jgi:hypothetical protein